MTAIAPLPGSPLANQQQLASNIAAKPGGGGFSIFGFHPSMPNLGGVTAIKQLASGLNPANLVNLVGGLATGDTSTWSKFGEGLAGSVGSLASTIAKPIGIPFTDYNLGDQVIEPAFNSIPGVHAMDLLQQARHEGIIAAFVNQAMTAAAIAAPFEAGLSGAASAATDASSAAATAAEGATAAADAAAAASATAPAADAFAVGTSGAADTALVDNATGAAQAHTAAQAAEQAARAEAAQATDTATQAAARAGQLAGRANAVAKVAHPFGSILRAVADIGAASGETILAADPAMIAGAPIAEMAPHEIVAAQAEAASQSTVDAAQAAQETLAPGSHQLALNAGPRISEEALQAIVDTAKASADPAVGAATNVADEAATVDEAVANAPEARQSSVAAKQAARISAPPPAWAQRLTDALPDGVNKVLAAMNPVVESYRLKSVARDISRFTEIAQRLAQTSPAATAAHTAAATILEAVPSLSEFDASHIIGEEIGARLDGTALTAAAVRRLGNGNLDLMTSLESIARRGYSGLTDGIKAQLTPDQLTAVEANISTAVDAQVVEGRARLQTLLTSTKGAKGLEAALGDDTAPIMTTKQLRQYNQALTDLRRSAKLLERAQEVVGRRAAEAERMQITVDENYAAEATRLRGLVGVSERTAETLHDGVPPGLANLEGVTIPAFMQAVATDGHFTYDVGLGRAAVAPTDGFIVTVAPQASVPIEQWSDLGPHTIRTAVSSPVSPNGELYGSGLWHGSDVRLDAQVGLHPTLNDGRQYVNVSLNQSTLRGTTLDRVAAEQIGLAYKQPHIFDVAAGAEIPLPQAPSAQDIAAHYLADTLSPSSAQSRVVSQITRASADVSRISPADVAAELRFAQTLDYSLSRANPEWTQGDLFKQMAVDMGKAKPAGQEWLLQQVLHMTPQEIQAAAKASISPQRLTDALAHYYDTKAYAESTWRGVPVKLLNGSTRDGAEVFYDMVAAHAVAADSGASLGGVLNGTVDIDKFIATRADAIERAKASMAELISGRKVTAARLSRSLPNDVAFGRLQIIADDNHTPVGSTPEMWTGKTGREAANLQAVHDNFYNPRIALSSTLDGALGDTLGYSAAGRPGLPQAYADQIDEQVAQLSTMLGREVRPAEVQALAHTYAGPDAGRLDWGRLLAHHDMGQQLLDHIQLDLAEGRPVDATRFDPMHDYFNEEHGVDTENPATPSKAMAAREDKYLAVRDRMQADIAAGNVDAAREKLVRWTMGERQAVRDLGAPTVAGEAGAQLRGTLEELRQRFAGQVRGATSTVANDTGRYTVRLFQDAGLDTLVRSSGLLLKQFLPADDLAFLEDSYPGILGKMRGIGTEAGVSFSKGFEAALAAKQAGAETAFVSDMMRFIRETVATGAEPAGPLSDVFSKIAATVEEQHYAYLDAASGAAVTPDVTTFWTRMFNPDVIHPDSIVDPLNVQKTIPSGVETKQFRWESANDFARRDRQYGEAREAVGVAQRKGALAERRLAQAQKAVTDMHDLVTEGVGATEPGAAALKLQRSAYKSLDTLSAALENPTTKQVVPAFQPLWESFKALAKEAHLDETGQLADMMQEIPKNFSEVLHFAAENGFEPTHISDLTWEQANRYLFGHVTVGNGTEIEAGLRKTRTGSLNRMGLADRSIEALGASTVQAVDEVQKNALVRFVEENWARPIPESGALPQTWKAWDSQRAYILTGTKATGETIAPGATMMIPEGVDRAIMGMSKNYDHWAFRLLTRVTKPWRTYLMSLSPKWYITHLIGNVAMASIDGVRLTDWVKAVRDFRAGTLPEDMIGRGFSSSMVSEYGDRFIGKQETSALSVGDSVKAVKEALARDGKSGAWDEARQRILKINDNVDQISRTAVYNKAIRTGASAEEALTKSYTALVDYGDLSPLERSVVRAAIPFYAWQKGMLKLVMRFPDTNPIAAAVMLQLGIANREVLKDKLGGSIPSAYDGLMSIPFLGTLNTTPYNPFQSATALTTSQGLEAALAPGFDAVIRDALNDPKYGTGVPGMTPTGAPGQRVDFLQAALQVVGGTPQARAITQATNGVDVYGTSPSALGIAAQVAGAPRVYSPAQLATISTKVQATQKAIATQQAGGAAAVKAANAAAAANSPSAPTSAPLAAPTAGALPGSPNANAATVKATRSTGIKIPRAKRGVRISRATHTAITGAIRIPKTGTSSRIPTTRSHHAAKGATTRIKP